MLACVASSAHHSFWAPIFTLSRGLSQILDLCISTSFHPEPLRLPSEARQPHVGMSIKYTGSVVRLFAHACLYSMDLVPPPGVSAEEGASRAWPALSAFVACLL